MTTATADHEWERYGLDPDTRRQLLEVRETIAQATEAECRAHPEATEAEHLARARTLAMVFAPTPPMSPIPATAEERHGLLVLSFLRRQGFLHPPTP